MAEVLARGLFDRWFTGKEGRQLAKAEVTATTPVSRLAAGIPDVKRALKHALQARKSAGSIASQIPHCFGTKGMSTWSTASSSGPEVTEDWSFDPL